MRTLPLLPAAVALTVALAAVPAVAAAAPGVAPPTGTVSAFILGPDGPRVERGTARTTAESEGLLAGWSREGRVLATATDTTLRAFGEPLRPQQWSLDRVRAEAAWELADGAGTTIAVIDSGVDATHPDLTPVTLPGADYIDVGGDGRTDPEGHGTAVAGVAAAALNGEGMVGLAPAARILPVRVIAADGTASSADVSEGILWAVEHGADVVNLSLGGTTSNRVLAAAVDHALAEGVVVVAAAGNMAEQGNPVVYPAAQEGVIAVGATGRSDARAHFSSYGDWVDIAAPGENLVVPMLGGGHGSGYGTSFAAPLVAAAAAQVRSAATGLAPAAVAAALTATAVDVGPTGRDADTGAGIVNPVDAIRAVAGRPVPTPTPTPTPAATSSASPAPRPSASPRPTPSPSPTPTPTPTAPQPAVDRTAAQADVVDAAVELSREVFPDGSARRVVLSRDDAFADSLAGTALAGEGGPVLFTRGGPDAPLRPEARAEITRVLAPGGQVYVLGGPNAVSTIAEAELAPLGHPVIRVAGASRVETALEIARLVDPAAPRVLLARADGWADAVTGGAYAAAAGVPVLLTASDSLHPAVAELLAGLDAEVVLLGGTAALSDAVATAAGADLRLAGETRAGTAVAIARGLWGREVARVGDRYVGVEGWAADSWAPALAAAVLSAVAGAPQLLLDGNAPAAPAETAGYLDELGYSAAAPGGATLVGPRLTDAHAAALLPHLGG